MEKAREVWPDDIIMNPPAHLFSHMNAGLPPPPPRVPARSETDPVEAWRKAQAVRSATTATTSATPLSPPPHLSTASNFKASEQPLKPSLGRSISSTTSTTQDGRNSQILRREAAVGSPDDAAAAVSINNANDQSNVVPREIGANSEWHYWPRRRLRIRSISRYISPPGASVQVSKCKGLRIRIAPTGCTQMLGDYYYLLLMAAQLAVVSECDCALNADSIFTLYSPAYYTSPINQSPAS